MFTELVHGSTTRHDNTWLWTLSGNLMVYVLDNSYRVPVDGVVYLWPVVMSALLDTSVHWWKTNLPDIPRCRTYLIETVFKRNEGSYTEYNKARELLVLFSLLSLFSLFSLFKPEFLVNIH